MPEPPANNIGVIEIMKKIQENYKIMQLYAPAISIQTKMKVQSALDNFTPEFNKTEIIKRIRTDGFAEWSMQDLFTSCKRICKNA